MKARKNPYKKGGACYFAWEAGYIAALDDMKMMEEAMDSVAKTMAEMEGGQADDQAADTGGSGEDPGV